MEIFNGLIHCTPMAANFHCIDRAAYACNQNFDSYIAIAFMCKDKDGLSRMY